jgi:pimeloyl-ACP methyl ester carboxylesterase
LRTTLAAVSTGAVDGDPGDQGGAVGSDPVVVERPGARLAGERWGAGRPGDRPCVVALHEGVADRRSWRPVARLVAHRATVVAYDRRGFGETPPSAQPFSHVDDLLAVLDTVASGPAWLAGTSGGAGVALDAAIVAPDRVAGLLLLAPGVSGAPMPELDPDTARLDRLLDEASAAGDLEEVNRLETRLWLDGPSQPEGRVGGATRALALEMNGIVLANGVPEGAGASGVDAWSRASEVTVPAVVGYGDLDVPLFVDRCEELGRRMPGAVVRRLEGVAHLSELERPDAVAGLLVDLLGRG